MLETLGVHLNGKEIGVITQANGQNKWLTQSSQNSEMMELSG
jgi:hypothetical protein